MLTERRFNLKPKSLLHSSYFSFTQFKYIKGYTWTKTKKRFFQRFQTFLPTAHKYLKEQSLVSLAFYFINIISHYYSFYCILHKTNTALASIQNHLPTSLHVLRFVHAHSKFDPQILIRACLGQSHLVELCLLWAVWSWVKNHLIIHHERIMIISPSDHNS